jgi:LysR family hydrogen peroxide-inducible transcriptional activator
MELQQLRYVLAVADTGNFTRASERSNVSQPSLSQQIINLEKELGHKLFHRLGRRAVPTEAGFVFIERARRILIEVGDAAREMKDSHAIDRTIKVGAIPTLAANLFPPLLALARKRFPQLLIQVQEDFRDELIQGVLEGVLDVAIVSLPVKEPQLSIETIFTESLLLVLGKNHPLAARPKIIVDDIKSEKFIMLGSASTLTQEIQRFCGDNQFEPAIASRCAQIATVKALVAIGVGISILPQATITPEDRSSLICRALSGRSPTREIGVIRHQLRYQSRGAEQFLSLLREHTQVRPERKS